MNLHSLDFAEEVEELQSVINKLGITINDDLINLSNNFNSNMVTTDDLLQSEKYIFKCWNSVRNAWLEKCFEHTKTIYKSPARGTETLTLLGSNITFQYERGIDTSSLEHKCNINNSNIQCESIIFSNAMSAINSMFLFISNLKKDNIKILSNVGYFETSNYLRLLSGTKLDFIFSHSSIDIVRKLDSNIDIIFIEPTSYNYDLEAIYFDKIIEKITSLDSSNISLFILDSTLLSENLFYKKLITELIQLNVIVIDIKSCLKFNQIGLEFSNAGIIKLISKKSKKNELKNISNYLKGIRTLTGSNITYYESCLIDNPFFFENSEYSRKILKNNYMFLKSLYKIKETHKLDFLEITPCKYQPLNFINNTPFIFIRIKNNNDKSMYEKILSYFVHDEKLNIINGSSFGFRHHRIEIIDDFNGKGFAIKIAIGYFRGISYYNLLNKMETILEVVNNE